MPIVPASWNPVIEQSGVSLSEYAYHLALDECAFWGVARPIAYRDEATNFCGVWDKPMRDMLARYLKEAQDQIERVTNFPLSPRYISGELHPCPRGIVLTNWHKVRALGSRAELLLESASFDWGNPEDEVYEVQDEAVFTHTWVGDVVPATIDEIEIRHVDSPYVIMPSAITFDAGAKTISVAIPRCRLVKPENADNPPEGWDYDDNDVFADTVDIWRVYTDTSEAGDYLCHDACTCNGVVSNALCGRVLNGAQGVIAVRPEIGHLCSCGVAVQASVNYLAGEPLTPEAREVIIRLAHTKMPEKFCDCRTWGMSWDYDNQQPAYRTFAQNENPFGLASGAWTAYQWANNMKSVRMNPLHVS